MHGITPGAFGKLRGSSVDLPSTEFILNNIFSKAFLCFGKFFSNSFLSTLHISSGPGKYFFFFAFFSLDGWVGETADAWGCVEVKLREDVEGEGDGAWEREEGRLLTLGIMTVSLRSRDGL